MDMEFPGNLSLDDSRSNNLLNREAEVDDDRYEFHNSINKVSFVI